MFGKRGLPTAQAVLADRVRQMAERKQPAEPEPDAQPRYRRSQQRAERAPIYRQGVVVIEGGRKLNVAIKNLSDTGARIEFFTRELLPGEVFLAEPTLKLRRWARVMWQGDGVAGLQFFDK